MLEAEVRVQAFYMLPETQYDSRPSLILAYPRSVFTYSWNLKKGKKPPKPPTGLNLGK